MPNTDMSKPKVGQYLSDTHIKKNVTVTKDRIEYNLIAFAIKNHKNVRCEVRGLTEGYLTANDTVVAK